MRRIYLLADDLTGAADSAACFAGRGLETILALDPAGLKSAGEANVLAYSTESRHDSAVEARGRVRAALAALPALGEGDLLFKKIDSTLRGYPAEELAEVAAYLGDPAVLIAPAFPAQGRITREGIQYARGLAVNDPALGYGVPSANLREVFARVGGARPDLYQPGGGEQPFEPGEWRVVDAQEDADLDRLAGAALAGGLRLVCGSGGLGAALARAWAPQVASPRCNPSRQPGVLVVAGSCHTQTLAQVRAAEAAGIPVVNLPGTGLNSDMQELLLARIGLALHSTAQACILSVRGLPYEAGSETRVAQALARLAYRAALSAPRPGRLVLTGGDSAVAFCREAGVQALRLLGEVAAGVPLGEALGGVLGEMQIVTKSGGFGEDLLLIRLAGVDAAA